MGKLCVRQAWSGLIFGALVGGLISTSVWAQGASVVLGPASAASTAHRGASAAQASAATAVMPEASSPLSSASAATEGAASAAEIASAAFPTSPIGRSGFSGAESSLPGLGVTLLGVAVVLMAVAWLVQRQRRRSESSSTHVFQVLSSLPLGGRDRLHLVQVEQQYFVIGHTPSQITFLSEVKPGSASAGDGAPPQPPSWHEAQDSMNAFFKQVEQSRP